ncbi:MAG: hypothetical protein PWQ62_764 [Candidatus Methanomethylophilaceae archaeon]|nr:hypothetical protein [Candidatus Methanomethylophilaceae archaeon]
MAASISKGYITEVKETVIIITVHANMQKNSLETAFIKGDSVIALLPDRLIGWIPPICFPFAPRIYERTRKSAGSHQGYAPISFGKMKHVFLQRVQLLQ